MRQSKDHVLREVRGHISPGQEKKKKRMLCIPGEKWIKPFLVYDVGWRSRVQQSDLVLLFSDT